MTRFFTRWLLLLLVVSLSACGGKEDRATDYLDRAQRSFDLGDYIKSELDAKNALQIEPNNIEAVKLRAILAEKQQKSREMFQFLRLAVELDPNDVESHVKLGRIFVAVGRFEDAQSHADSALGVDPNDANARILNATIMFKQDKIEEARAIADNVLSSEPRNAAALAFLASTYQSSEPDRAITLLDQAVNAEPENEGLRKVKIALLKRLNRPEEAERELRNAIGVFPDKNEYRYTLATELGRAGKVAEAEQVINNIISADANDMTAKLFYAQFVGNHKDPEAAVTSLKGYIQNEPEIFEYRFALAQVYVMTRKIDEAKGVYQGIIDKDSHGPYGINAKTKLGSISLIQNDVPGARELIGDVLKDEPNNADALIMRASIRLQNDETPGAIGDLRTILRDNPSHENARLLLGKAHVQAGENNLALEELQRLIGAYPNNIEGRRDLATLLVQNQRWDEVRTLLEEGVRQSPTDLQMTRMLIDTYMRQEEWDLAQANADRLLEQDPGSPIGHYVVARLLQAQGKYRESIPAFKRALDFAPDAVENITGLIRSYARANLTDDALAFLQKFVPEHPDNVQAITLLGEMQARKEQWAAAEATNERALEKNPSWLPAYRNLIGIHLRAGATAKANATVERGLRQSPGNADLTMLKASIFERQDRWDDAIDVYEKLLERNSGLDIAANNYIALVADHRTDQASFEKALAYGQRFKDSDNPIFQDTLGWLHYRLNDYNTALPMLEAAVAKAGQLQQLRYHLGMTYFKLDRLENARVELEAALKNPDAEYVGIEEAKSTLDLL